MKLLKEKNPGLWKSSDFQYVPGIGVKGMANNKSVTAAGPNYFTENGYRRRSDECKYRGDCNQCKIVEFERQMSR